MSAPPSSQTRASDPSACAFVTANAGSGKTKTLVDRVARLLLRGARPEAILCVTYTKAAAAEMQRRLFETLGSWAVASDEALAAELVKIEERPENLSAARALFARALETPGGLKIQTIHAFCEKLLRRFPLEAGVSPGFTVMEDAAAAEIVREARDAVARHALAGEGAIAAAYRWFSVALDYGAFESMFAEFEARRDALAAYIARCGGLAGAVADVWDACGFPDGPIEPERIEAEALSPPAFDAERLRHCIEALARGGATDSKCAQTLASAIEAGGVLSLVLEALFTADGEGTPRAFVRSTAAFRATPHLREHLLAEQERLHAARERLRSARVARDSVHMLVLASAYAAAYAAAKAARGALDFADLIGRARDLLRDRPSAAWVLYKLDGGVDHILVDEAQDTAPAQWEILRALSTEFFAGEPAGRPARRTLFAVGDEKQSIYSFQGAAPERLLVEQRWHQEVVEGSGGTFQAVPLLESWRSTPAVLTVVDAVFRPPDRARALQPRTAAEGGGAGDIIRHIAMRADHPGCVDLWPLFQDDRAEDRQAWDAPLDARAAGSANRRLAEAIAGEIAAVLARGDRVYDKEARIWRAATAGDVLILVRRRRALFEEILRAIKRARPAGGGGGPAEAFRARAVRRPDRARPLLPLPPRRPEPGRPAEEPVVRRLPRCVRRGALRPGAGAGGKAAVARAARAGRRAAAMGRGGRSARLGARRRATGDAVRLLCPDAEPAGQPGPLHALAHPAAAGLGGRGRAGRLPGPGPGRRAARGARPRDLRRRDGLQRGRGEARAGGRQGRGPGDDRPRRQGPGGADRVPARDGGEGGRPRLAAPGDRGGPVPVVRLGQDRRAGLGRRAPAPGRAAVGRDPAAALRRLTRARDRLVVAGRIAATDDPDKAAGWYGAVREAFESPDLAQGVRPMTFGALEGRRFGPDPERGAPSAPSAADAAPAPAWLARPAPTEPPALAYASPSHLAEAGKGPAPSPLASVGGLGRFRRGDLVHRLLQLLPDIAPERRAAAARSLLAREADLTDAQREEMAAAAMAVLTDARFAAVFGPGSRAEVAIAGSAPGLPDGLAVSGRIDRLVVEPDRVLVVDYKTNRPSPDRIEDADRAYIVQMAVYSAVLAAIFPGRRIEAALVWTDGPKLMPVPENLVAEALLALPRSG